MHPSMNQYNSLWRKTNSWKINIFHNYNAKWLIFKKVIVLYYEIAFFYKCLTCVDEGSMLMEDE